MLGILRSVLCVGSILLAAARPWAAARDSAAEADTLVRNKLLGIKARFDFGQITHGYNTEADKDFNAQFFQRTALWFTQETFVGRRLAMKMGVGGVFWYPIPPSPDAPHTLLTKFGPGISQAHATWKFGDPEHPPAELQMGLFPYKYDPEASNLGEYLLRSGTYPGYLTTGGWNVIGTAEYMAQGLRLGVKQGDFKADLLLTMERDIPPMYDFTPSAVASWSPHPAFRLGAGVAFGRLLAIHPSQESPRQHVPGLDYSLNDYVYPKGDPHCNADTANALWCRDSTQHYTLQGVKLMATAGFDPKAFLPSGPFGPEDLKLSFEMALLGVENYPFFYENRFDRMPFLVSFNVPAFRLLDLLSVQAEYIHARFPNDIYVLYQNQLPVWNLRDNLPQSNDPSRVASSHLNWSLLARREVTKGIKIFVQAANDHLRTFDYNVQLSGQPVTTRLSDWYYVVRLELGI